MNSRIEMKGLILSLQPSSSAMISREIVGMYSLSDEIIAYTLSFLQSKELGVVNIVDKSVFGKQRLQIAIKLILGNSCVIPLTSPLKRQQSLSCTTYTPSALYVFEITNILSALSTPVPMSEQKGM